MIDQVDELIGSLLAGAIKEGKLQGEITHGGVTSSGPAGINLYLYSIRENVALRSMTREVIRGDGTEVGGVRRGPVTFELKYLITARGAESSSEHRLLSAALLALTRRTYYPTSELPEPLQAMDGILELIVAQPASMADEAALWQSVCQPARASIFVSANLTVNPYEPAYIRLVRRYLVGIGQGVETSGPNRSIQTRSRQVAAAGLVVDAGARALDGVIVKVTGRTESTTTDHRGLFFFEGLTPGTVELEFSAPQFVTQHRTTVVPPPGRPDLLEPLEVVLVRSNESVAPKSVKHDDSPRLRLEISGRLKYDDGRVAAYVPVRAGSIETVTDVYGNYTLKEVKPEFSKVEAEMPGRGWVSIASESENKVAGKVKK